MSIGMRMMNVDFTMIVIQFFLMRVELTMTPVEIVLMRVGMRMMNADFAMIAGAFFLMRFETTMMNVEIVLISVKSVMMRVENLLMSMEEVMTGVNFGRILFHFPDYPAAPFAVRHSPKEVIEIIPADKFLIFNRPTIQLWKQLQ